MASIGFGVYILSYIWFSAFLLVWISIRTGLSLGKVAILVSAFISLLLCLLPKIDVELTYSDKLYDKFYTVRYFTIGLILLGNITGATYTYLYTCYQPVEFRKIRRFGS